MTELPELSGVAKRVRPVPPGGVDAAVRAGRRRRNRVVGAAAGGVTSIVIVAAAVLAAPGSHDESLQPAQQPSVIDKGVTTAPSQAPAAAVAAAAAQRLASQRAAGQAPVPAAASADPHRPTATAAPPAAERDDYTESPRDNAAPQTCRQGPAGSTGPVVYGGATVCSTASSGPSSVKRGGHTYGSTDMCVPYGGKATVLGYSSGEEHEVIVTNEEGELVYRFSDTVRFVQGKHSRTIGEGRCLEWTGTWDTTYTNGKLVPRGRYTVTVGLRPATIGGRKPESGEGSMGYSVDVQ